LARVLIVDDEPSMLQMLQMNLQMEGHDTLLAADGATALKRVETEDPDLILLDIMMPVLDGWEVLRRLGTLALRKRPRVVVMTAKSGDQDLRKGLLLGADEYVTKPFEIDELIESVSRLLELTEPEIDARREAMKKELS
jgi:DNA-binding response OmpR family regulator